MVYGMLSLYFYHLHFSLVCIYGMYNNPKNHKSIVTLSHWLIWKWFSDKTNLEMVGGASKYTIGITHKRANKTVHRWVGLWPSSFKLCTKMGRAVVAQRPSSSEVQPSKSL